jgi:GR25 family glycosyltransferase involved in LPS biosynthesis
MVTAYVIHLEAATERLPVIEELKEKSGLPVQIFSASDGEATWNNSAIIKEHPWKFTQLTRGMIGCLESHMAILEIGAASTGPFFLFEDDAEMLAPFQDFIDGAPPGWDILLLGANEIVNSMAHNKKYRRVLKFWGAHAMVVHGRCCSKILELARNHMQRGIYLPADWLYNTAIKTLGIPVYCSNGPGFFKQKNGLISSITGNVRTI